MKLDETYRRALRIAGRIWIAITAVAVISFLVTPNVAPIAFEPGTLEVRAVDASSGEIIREFSVTSNLARGSTPFSELTRDWDEEPDSLSVSTTDGVITLTYGLEGDAGLQFTRYVFWCIPVQCPPADPHRRPVSISAEGYETVSIDTVPYLLSEATQLSVALPRLSIPKSPSGTDPEFIVTRDSVKREFLGVLSYAARVRNMQRSARKTYHDFKNNPTIAPDVVALFEDTLTWESPQKIIEDLAWDLMGPRARLYTLDVAYRNLFNTDYFEGITIEERKRYEAMKSATSQPAQEKAGNVPEATPSVN